MTMKTGESTTTVLGGYLFDLRNTKRMTLREVEAATGNTVSNAYLSQLENGKIAQPSPNILYQLANVYGASYDLLMEKAGYIVSQSATKRPKRHGKVATFAVDDLTADEQAEVLKYLAFHVLEVQLLPAEAFAIRSPRYLELTDATRAALIKHAHDLGAALVECHSHPGQLRAEFSPSDLTGFEEFVPHIRWRLKGRPYAALVFTRQDFDAFVWNGDSHPPQPAATPGD